MSINPVSSPVVTLTPATMTPHTCSLFSFYPRRQAEAYPIPVASYRRSVTPFPPLRLSLPYTPTSNSVVCCDRRSIDAARGGERHSAPHTPVVKSEEAHEGSDTVSGRLDAAVVTLGGCGTGCDEYQQLKADDAGKGEGGAVGGRGVVGRGEGRLPRRCR